MDELATALAAARGTPFYAGRWRRSPDGPRAELSVQAITTRSDLQQHRDRMLGDGDRSEWTVTDTTGTTGQPVVVVVDAAARALDAQILAEVAGRHGAASAWHHRGVLHIVLQPSASSRSARVAWSPTAVLIKWNLLRVWQLDDADFSRSLRPLDGAVVTGSPITLDLVADRVDGIQPALIVLSGERIAPGVEERLRGAFGCPVTSLYTLGEVGIIGVACAQGGYHIDSRVVVAEILDDQGEPVAEGVTGRITLTTLVNRAMALVRYQPGDTVRRLAECGCALAGQRLELVGVREPAWLTTDDETSIHVVRFAKLWRTLKVRAARVQQRPDGTVDVSYDAAQPFSHGEQAVVFATIRSAVGLRQPIAIRYEANMADNARAATVPVIAAKLAETRPGLISDVRDWVRERLTERNFVSAILFGSVVRPAAMTRFSDIDITILVAGQERLTDWAGLIRAWREELPALRVHVDRVQGIDRRVPMVAARLLAEGVLIAGNEPGDVIPRPRRGRLRQDAMSWGWQTAPVLGNQLTQPGIDDRDVVEVAYLAQKHIVTACRYHHLMRGGRETYADQILAHLPALIPRIWLADAMSAVLTAREHKPPPPPGEGANLRHLRAAVATIEALTSR